VRWYITYKLNHRDLRDMMAERGINLPLLGFKKFENAAVTISGIELAHKIRKGQFDTSSIGLTMERTPQVWEAAQAA
jgi:transposase-like protein